MSPIWKQAKDNFLTHLSNAQHAGRMERIRLIGKQNGSYILTNNSIFDPAVKFQQNWERMERLMR